MAPSAEFRQGDEPAYLGRARRLLVNMTPDEKADRIIKGLTATGVAAGGVPVPLLIPFMATVAGGVVAIGASYGVRLSKEDAWKLIREFFKAAGFVYTATFIGGAFITWILAATGVGYPVALALDAAQCAVIGYTVGTAAKHYFKGERSQSEMRKVVRGAMAEARASFSSKGAGRG
jgi:uncharacterized protein (DUF697 family)